MFMRKTTRINRKLPILLISCICLSSQLAVAEMYKWVDDEGNTHYTQSPPPGDVEKEIIKPEPEDGDDFVVEMSTTEGKEFDTPYPINMGIGEEALEPSTPGEEIVADDDYDSEEDLNLTPPPPEPLVVEESKTQSVKATTPTTGGIIKKNTMGKNRID